MSFITIFLRQKKKNGIFSSTLTFCLFLWYFPFRLLWLVKECSYSSFSCRVKYYLIRRDIQSPTLLGLLPAEYASSSSAIQTLLSALIPPSPKCLAQHRYMLFASSLLCMKKGLEKFIRGRSLQDSVGLPATFLPFQNRTEQKEQRGAFYWSLFFLSLLSPPVPVDIAFC